MGDPSTRMITLGSRPSRLALWQTHHILSRLQTAWPEVTFRVITLVTEGDRNMDQPLPEIGGKGLFTSELETALCSGEVDLAVHSLKDLPVDPTTGLCIGAIGQRADARDVLVSAGKMAFKDLPPGARVGTSSLRRSAQLLALRPDLALLPLRGNVDTRVRKAFQGDYDAIVLAAAGIERLDLGHVVGEYLPFELMLPAPGQGALAVQCRENDAFIRQILEPIHDPGTFRCVSAERAFLSALGGGCSAPVAAYARSHGSELELAGLVASPDGSQVIRVTASGRDPLDVGRLAAGQALCQGAGKILV